MSKKNNSTKTRLQAAAEGLTTYEGSPCRKCKKKTRFTSNGNCVVCARASSRIARLRVRDLMLAAKESAHNAGTTETESFLVAHQEPSYSQLHVDLAERMAAPVRIRRPSQKIDIEAWADDIRKLQKIDGYTLEQIEWLWNWIQNHDDGGFRWGDQILSPRKLRTRKDGLSYFDKCKQQAMAAPRARRETDQERRARIIAERNKKLGFDEQNPESTTTNFGDFAGVTYENNGGRNEY